MRDQNGPDRVTVVHRALIRVAGRVQGVGFRWWAMGEARDLGLVGYAENLPDGRVEISAQGELPAVQAMIRRTLEVPTSTGRPGRITGYEVDWVEPNPKTRGFGYL